MGFFKSKAKTPQEAVRIIKDSLPKLDPPLNQDKRSVEKAQEDISKNLEIMKHMLGDRDNDPVPELVAQLAQEVYTNDLLQVLVRHLGLLQFEAKKDVSQIFNSLLRRQLGTRFPTVEYICTCDSILRHLAKGFDNPEIALHCGMMLRECIRHEALCKLLLHDDDVLYNLFMYVELPNFDVASEAFATFKDILTKHKIVVAEYLEKNYDRFFKLFNRLLLSQNYVTRRQSVKLLGELLLDRPNLTVMMLYIGDKDNLKIIMDLLRDESPNIQYEAFHVFKVFVANPSKPKAIEDILVKNKEKLIDFLNRFYSDKDDDQLNDEKMFLIKQIQDLGLSS